MQKTKSAQAASAAEPPKRKRALRARPVPKWVKLNQDLDEMARRRCLMILNVLSGAQPVSAAIEEAQISRGLYYQLETKAMRGMLAALMPSTDSEGEPAISTTERVTQLEAKVTHLEREKRRLERLLYVTKQIVRPGPVAQPTGRGRKPSTSSSTKSGKPPSPASPTTTASSPPSPASAPTGGGAGARSGGSGN